MSANMRGGQNRLAQASVIKNKERHCQSSNDDTDQCDTQPVSSLTVGNQRFIRAAFRTDITSNLIEFWPTAQKLFCLLAICHNSIMIPEIASNLGRNC